MFITFDRQKEAEPEVALAKLIAQLVREGVRFIIRTDRYSYEVELTGGF